MTLLSAPRMTETDANHASDSWGMNCGPAAICAILNMLPDEVRPHMGEFEKKRHTSPTMMVAALNSLGIGFEKRVLGQKDGDWVCEKIDWPAHGLARVQWEGNWTRQGANPRWAYRFTHWIAVHQRDEHDIGVFDVNCMNNGTGWISQRDWRCVIAPWIIKESIERGSGGWHLTHAIEVLR